MKITKERVKDILEFGAGRIISPITDDEIMELSRIALASLEAEAVGEVIEQQSGMMLDGLVISEKPTYRNIKGIHNMKMMPLGTKFYTAPPAPVVPAPTSNSSSAFEDFWSNFEHPFAEDDELKSFASEIYRAAMLKHSEPFIVTSDHRMMEMPQVEAINAVTAMLQGVENAETPTTMQTAPALDSSPKIAELPSGNSPVIPDGWVMVPEDPTHEMLEAGDEQFGTYDVYRRMIEAAPKLE